MNPDTIFANNEMSLQDIEIYGFDYDYTLAFYSSHLHTLIFNVARDILIQQHRVCTQWCMQCISLKTVQLFKVIDGEIIYVFVYFFENLIRKWFQQRERLVVVKRCGFSSCLRQHLFSPFMSLQVHLNVIDFILWGLWWIVVRSNIWPYIRFSVCSSTQKDWSPITTSLISWFGGFIMTFRRCVAAHGVCFGFTP